ncbi:hypothetical protein ACFVY1_42100 [Streptomyces sp. NPDC058293]|uniref:hypothetical protein n=1 Tax=Streptomyces sp. NPDC058293 TaxID=3346429 RepID=UPI0036E92D74
MTRILCHSEFSRKYADRGLAPRARRDAEQSIASGRFTAGDPVAVLAALNGGLLTLLELWFAQPEVDNGQASDRWPRCPALLGLSACETRDIARRPLPAAA